MISFESFCLVDGVPLYTQIIRFIKCGVAAGSICSGDELPSRRVLSATLGVNPNTIQKAYRILEDEAVIVSHAGSKSFVTADAARADALRAELLEADTRAWVGAMRQMGVGRAAALAAAEALWGEAGGPAEQEDAP